MLQNSGRFCCTIQFVSFFEIKRHLDGRLHHDKKHFHKFNFHNSRSIKLGKLTLNTNQFHANSPPPSHKKCKQKKTNQTKHKYMEIKSKTTKKIIM